MKAFLTNLLGLQPGLDELAEYRKLGTVTELSKVLDHAESMMNELNDRTIVEPRPSEPGIPPSVIAVLEQLKDKDLIIQATYSVIEQNPRAAVLALEMCIEQLVRMKGEYKDLSDRALALCQTTNDLLPKPGI